MTSLSELDPLAVIEGVKRSGDPAEAWDHFSRLLARAGFEDLNCYYGAPLGDEFPDRQRTRFNRGVFEREPLRDYFAQHPQFKQGNPIVRHCKASLRPLIGAGHDPAVPFSAKHLQMLEGLREALGDVDLNIFPLPGPRLGEFGNLTVFSRRTADGRHAMKNARDALHLAGIYFCTAAGDRFSTDTRDEAIRLAPREKECLSLVASGLVTKEIASRLGLSCKTVDLYIANGMKKLGARTRSHAAARAVALSLIDV